jgi:hypothetical protein
MAEVEYGITNAKPLHPISLLRVPHQGRRLTVGFPPFEPEDYQMVGRNMRDRYFHSNELPEVSFEELTTAESISVVAYDVADAKARIFHPSLLRLGPIVSASEGIFVNPPKDQLGKFILDGDRLKKRLNKAEKVGKVWLGEKDFGFAPYETFKLGPQTTDEFVFGGLAIILEHTCGDKAEKLAIIASPEFFQNGVSVEGFDGTEKSILKYVSLNSGRQNDDWRLMVRGGYFYDGYKFGKLKQRDKR